MILTLAADGAQSGSGLRWMYGLPNMNGLARGSSRIRSEVCEGPHEDNELLQSKRELANSERVFRRSR